MKSYGIKDGYEIRTELHLFDDTPYKDEFQNDVYKLASEIVADHGLEQVIDLGCGSGFKLMKYFSHLQTIGIDRKPTVEWLNRTYLHRTWLTPEEFRSDRTGHNLLICSDVIEHVEDPDLLLDRVVQINPAIAVFSTPDRDLLGLGTENGPPKNCHHIREWNHDEFVAYLGERFNVQKSVRGKTIIAIVSVK